MARKARRMCGKAFAPHYGEHRSAYSLQPDLSAGRRPVQSHGVYAQCGAGQDPPARISCFLYAVARRRLNNRD
jgi:hypothetical protein